MGWHAARKLRKVVDNLAAILGIELLAASRAVDLRAPLQPAPRTGAVIAALRAQVAGPGPDRFQAPEVEIAAAFVRAGHAR